MISLQRWRAWDVRVQDAPLALLLALASLVPALHDKGTQLGGLPNRPFDALAIAVIALECLPLVFRRKWPLVCLAVVSVAFAADQLRGYHTVAGTALSIALISAGLHLSHHRRGTVIALSAGYAGLAVALELNGATEGVAGFVTFYLAVAALWAIGAWLRLSRSAEEERRRHVAAASRVAERTLIARELHDVVTHHVTAMVVQAEAARYLTAAPDRLDQTLQAITDTGRRSLTDLRHLLDLLNPDHSTEALGDLRTLVEQTRLAGQPVEFAEEGEATRDAGSAEAVAYRVVQEALTNALKYAHGNPTNVHVRYGEREITVEVGTEGARSSTAVGGSGRGLAGLRERVDVLGGEFSAGQRDGGFVVRARIPAGNPA
ncbi:sensor histidine kinase [Lentzea flaviverrucosa]|uniref:histidine kinase n=1 Tax=Lentzea flaviverrucosa TaxID=200379 RepID=A0A1H9D5F0_9PSEU|nr:histidine kinase [Lentzea flaviverrucosa]RDI24751.1 signal transduction histidine kinase [Lentzea flaviverrucosa]SEQ08609.1 Signal transduction histidine kinase [Lentzea flaviverrucosa]